MKFLRTYSLALEVGPYNERGDATQHIVIPSTEFAAKNPGEVPPMTVEFDIRREFLASAQTGTFTVYNLGEMTRNRIYKDRYDTGRFAAIQFRAGYMTQAGFMPLLFNGTIRWAYSSRENADSKTTIEAFDGGFAMANSFTSRTVYAGETLQETLRFLGADMVGLTASAPGAETKQKTAAVIGAFPQKSQRGTAMFGPTWKVLQETLPLGALATIDNGQLKILNRNEYIAYEATPPVLNSKTGLLSTPIRSGATITCKMLFEPRLTIGQAINLQSDVNTLYNGVKIVVGFRHHGTISPATGGDCHTEVTLWQGTAALNPVWGTSPQ